MDDIKSKLELVIPQGEKLHPAAYIALMYIQSLGMKKLDEWRQKFLNLSYSNKMAEACLTTLEKMNRAETITESELFGLAWLLRFNVYKKDTQSS